MQTPNTHWNYLWHQEQFVTNGNASRKNTTRNNHTRTLDAEPTIYREPELPVLPSLFNVISGKLKCNLQRFHAFICDRGDRVNLGVFEKSPAHNLGDLFQGSTDLFLIAAIDLGERNQAVIDSKEIEYFKMLERLRHDTIISGDH